ncbi:uncharacterized protein YjlB [Rhodopseudomonas thermotolerans]|uniref:Uncharacterized protein YjlB n=2 Tax=Rhodopseudomonas TaxID=1073 RepID=A0A336JLQ2_9BRAD|nr:MULTISPECIES: hypothetical protein [Rhodopseudomonas]RED37653.1 uncharacterized protein YjlB [Rhodopseudomonas pentothenatexigens]REG04139.1 uncharacterized protein YjlB [Rhodopseudomonas thermotolerans]SSW90620.1 uncharacterized protein YjlB [Rhodopseudomonas pentothenatexigens]
MSLARDQIKPLALVFDDDGLIPNNPLPLLLYKHAFDIGERDPEQAVEDLFARNGWGDRWRNGIFDYQHYHATVHEALGVARGRAMVLFGGEQGEAIELTPGDIAVLPAGTGHKCLFASHDFRVVGAYPPGPKMQVTRPTPDNYRRALQSVPRVPLPETDPVFGKDGPLPRLWK